MFLCAALLCQGAAQAATHALPPADQSLIGAVQYIQSKYEDTLLTLGRRYGIGYEEIVAANPTVNPWLPGAGTTITIPSRYILPDVPRVGIVVNVAEHRLYYFPQPKPGEQAVVHTYPVSTGKVDWNTPMGLTKIVAKQAKPAWYPPESVRSEHAARGDYLPKMVPPGPNNPLGEFAMRLGFSGGSYLIHGTNKPVAVGMEVTHGCVRMFPEDIEQFFDMVPVGTPVRIVNQPTKMGWGEDGGLYMESHKPPEGREEGRDLSNITRALVSATQERPAAIDWQEAERVFLNPSGLPTLLSVVAQ